MTDTHDPPKVQVDSGNPANSQAEYPAPSVIAGLYVYIPGQEFRDICQLQADHHRKRETALRKEFADKARGEADAAEDAALEFADGDDFAAALSNSGKYGHQDEKTLLQQRIRRHQTKRRRFAFFARYLSPDKVYQLSERDLSDFDIEAFDLPEIPVLPGQA